MFFFYATKIILLDCKAEQRAWYYYFGDYILSLDYDHDE